MPLSHEYRRGCDCIASAGRYLSGINMDLTEIHNKLIKYFKNEEKTIIPVRMYAGRMGGHVLHPK